MPELIVKQAGFPDTVYKLEGLRSSIGRSARNDVCLTDPFASRLHAEIRREGDNWFLIDLGSVNGTLCNGMRVTGRTPLRSSDRMQIGETHLIFAGDRSKQQSVSSSVAISDALSAATPEHTIAPRSGARPTEGLLSMIEGAKTGPQRMTSLIGQKEAAPARDLLAIISQVGVALLSNVSLDETLAQIMDLVFDTIPADRGYLLLKDKTTSDLVCKVARKRGAPVERVPEQVQISRSIIEQVVSQGNSVLTSDAIADPRFSDRQSIVLSNIRSVMAVPLAIDRQSLGMVYVDNPFDTNRFTDSDLQVLTTIAGVAAIKIENSLLLEERLEKRRMEEELAVASEIQMRLQPVSPPKIDKYDLTAISFACREIGGDYYDFIDRPNGKWVLTLGDVSGKGTGAALLMASLHAAVRAQAQTSLSIESIVKEINAYIYRNSPDNKFVTLFLAELDPLTGVLTYSNAGHNPPVLVRASDDIEHLTEGGLPVGIRPDLPYGVGSVELRPGDILVTFSDGVTEAVNDKDEEFGEDRLVALVKKHRSSSAASLRDLIDEAVGQFAGKQPAFDDMTLLIAKRLP